MSYLWPIVTGVSFIDVWTLPHLGFWVVVGSTFWALRRWVHKWVGFCLCLGLSFIWEWSEKWAEVLWPDIWLDPESWVNSWLSDPMTCVIGFLGIWWLLDHRKRRT